MSWGPVRTVSMGGVLFGVLVLVAGIFLFLWSQHLIPFDLTFTAVCSLGLIVLGVIILGGVLWGRRMMRGGWRRWASDWDQGWQRPPSPPPQP
ncbi:MAG: hypothetical protein A3K65_08320 [Euryarchaeota archaeon RBG_16_68_12]|nr:MAG: hypothetical protein A3K65_08320 [Euryarchaeota archaeon RBG_16_68_12]